MGARGGRLAAGQTLVGTTQQPECPAGKPKPEAIKAGIEAHEQMTASERAIIDQQLAALRKRQKELDRDADKMIAAFKSARSA